MNTLIKKQKLNDLIFARDIAQKSAETIHENIEKLTDIFSNAGAFDGTYFSTYGIGIDKFDLGKTKKRIDECAWKYVIEKSMISEFMTKKAKDEFIEKLQNSPPPFTKEELELYIESLSTFYGENAENMVKEVYNQCIGCYYYGPNWGHAKKDNLRQIERQFRCYGQIIWSSWDGGCFEFNNYNQNYSLSYDDLYRVCLLLDGKPPAYGFDFRALAQAQLKSDPKNKGVVETPYFKVQGYKNGNNKVTWTNLAILAKFNKVGSGTNKLPDEMRKRYKPEHFSENGVETIQYWIAKYSLPKSNDEGFYETPVEIAKQMVKWLEAQESFGVLEPSAGNGVIIDALQNANKGWPVFVSEINIERRNKLISKYHDFNVRVLSESNFIKHSNKHKFIIMNPPFEHGNAICHILKAWTLLKDGGRIISILPVSFIYRGDGLHKFFREQIFEKHAVSLEIPYYLQRNIMSYGSIEDKRIVLLERGIFKNTEIGACVVCLQK